MGILVVGIIAFVVLTVSVFNAEKDWSAWTGVWSGFILVICLIFGSAMEDKQPKAIETTHPPKIDTIITIKNHVPDTTYVYTFIEKEKDQ